MKDADGLTPRQRAFIDAYLAGPRPNATQAAAVAGYSFPGKQGSRLLSHPAVHAAIRPELDRRAVAHRESMTRLMERRAARRGGTSPC